MPITISEILDNLKKNPSQETSKSNPGAPGNSMYWTIIRLIQAGGSETVNTFANQLGIAPDILLERVKSFRDLYPDFPVRVKHNPDNPNETVISLNPGQLAEVRDIVSSISPEHMLDDAIKRHLPNKPEDELIKVHVLFDAFRHNLSPYSPYSAPLAELVRSVFYATPGLKDIRDTGSTPIIVINTLDSLLVVMPVVGADENGYFADHHHVLEARYMAQTFAEGNLEYNLFIPILVSLDFVIDARRAALLDPKVCMLPLWGLVKLLGFLQTSDSRITSSQAFVHIHELSQKSVAYDGHVLETIKYLEGQHEIQN